MRGFGHDDARGNGSRDDESGETDAHADDPTNATRPASESSGAQSSDAQPTDDWSAEAQSTDAQPTDDWDDWDEFDDEFDLPADTAEFEALGQLDLGSSAIPNPLPPEDRLWRHPSELQFMTPAEPERRSVGLGAVTGIALGAGLVGALLAVASLRLMGDDPTIVVERRLESASGPAGEQPVRFSNTDLGFVEVAEAVTPAIAMVAVTAGDRNTRGSAVAFRTGGGETAFMTNAHVVRDATDVQLILHDGRELAGQVAGVDARTDIATVIVDVDGLTIALLGGPAPVRVGQQAMAVGSPLGLDGGPSATVGIISGIRRTIDGAEGHALVDMIQTDAAIASGSSGGALVDRDGAVIGITTAVAVDDSSATGLAFATPIDVAHDVAVQLLETGRAQHAWIGITGRDATDIPGVEIISVAVDGPSAATAVQPGDVIVAVDGTEIGSMNDLTSILMRRDPGDPAALRLDDGRVITVVCGERPDSG